MASGLQMTSGNHSLAPRAQLVRPGTKPFLSSPVQCTSLAIAPVAGHLHVSPSGGQGQTRPVVGKREKLMMSASSFHPTLRYLGRHLPSQAISTQAQCSHLCQARFVPSRSFLPGWALLVPLLVQLHRTEATALSLRSGTHHLCLFCNFRFLTQRLQNRPRQPQGELATESVVSG